MGYVTNFKLQLEGEQQVVDSFIAAKVKVASYDSVIIGELLEEYDGKYQGSWKWYDYDSDMTNISSAWPEITFILTGYGEEPGDIWQYKYRSGSKTGGKATILFEDEEDVSDVRDIFK
jgi:hypothetical protein